MKFIRYQIRFALPVWLSMLVTSFLPDNRYSIKFRGWLVSFFLPQRPKGLTLGRDVTFLGIDKLLIGDNVYIAKGCWINALGGISIEKEVMLAPYVVIVSTKHAFKECSVYRGHSEFKPVRIGAGSWIAAHSTVVAGAVVGAGSIVAANSVVVKKYDDGVILSGVPAIVLKAMNSL